MSNPGDVDATPISSVRQLADFIAVGSKPRERFTIGTEHEKFGFYRADYRAPAYEDNGIRAVLEGMAPDGWTPPPEQVLERAAWWADIFNVPCVAYANTLEEVADLAAARVDFIALREAVWNDPRGADDAVRDAQAIIDGLRAGA